MKSLQDSRLQTTLTRNDENLESKVHFGLLFSPSLTNRAFQLRWLLPPLFRLLAIALGGLHAWAAAMSHSMNADGISYLDIGDAYMRGDWQTAINPIWSPMYSWILGPVMYLVNPPIHWEFPLVHAVNFVIYLVAMGCFEFFWRQLMRYSEFKTAAADGRSWVTLPAWAWLPLGYTLFIFVSLNLIEIWAVTPDMLMAAFVYLAAGLILRLRLGFSGWPTFILLGTVLGLAYLAKAVMFPISFVFLVVALFSIGDVRRAGPRVLGALLMFLLFSVPFIALISGIAGELTFSTAGKLTYARYLNGVPYPHWQGDPPGNGTPEHPSRKILDRPPIYEFGAPIGGTYPLSYNPTYWYKGVEVHFDLNRQIDYLLFSILFYFDLFFRQQASLVIGVLLLYVMSRWPQLRLTEIVFQWGLVIVALAAFGMYGIVNVLGRYVGVFVVLFWADLLANVRLPDSQLYRKLASLLSVSMILFMLINIAAFNLQGFRDLIGWGNPHQLAAPPAGSLSWPGEVAEELHRLGLQAGDNVAIIGYGFDSFWARLARIKIVAELLDTDAEIFWTGDSSVQSDVIRAFSSTGARAIVAESVPSYASLSGWHQVGNSNYYIYLLDE